MKKGILLSMMVLFLVVLADKAGAELKVWVKADLSKIAIPEQGPEENKSEYKEFPMKNGKALWSKDGKLTFYTHEALKEIVESKKLKLQVPVNSHGCRPGNTKGVYLVALENGKGTAIPVMFDLLGMAMPDSNDELWHGGYIYAPPEKEGWLDKNDKEIFWTAEYGSRP